jgi:hypothetical protein
VLLLKTDGQGNEEWRKTYGDVEGWSVEKTADGGFIVAGTAFGPSALLLKVNELGNI